MAGLGSATHVASEKPPWMPGPSPGMNEGRNAPFLLRGGHRGLDPFIGITPDLFDVASLDADQPGRPGAARRMQIALVIDIGIARGELVIADRTRLPDHALARRRDPLIVGHDRLAEGLAIDRPGRPV